VHSRAGDCKTKAPTSALGGGGGASFASVRTHKYYPPFLFIQIDENVCKKINIKGQGNFGWILFWLVKNEEISIIW